MAIICEDAATITRASRLFATKARAAPLALSERARGRKGRTSGRVRGKWFAILAPALCCRGKSEKGFCALTPPLTQAQGPLLETLLSLCRFGAASR